MYPEQQKDNDFNNDNLEGEKGEKGDNSERDRGYGDEVIFLEQAHGLEVFKSCAQPNEYDMR